MKRLLAVLLLALSASACDNVSQAQFDAHVARYQYLVDSLQVWSQGVYEWGARTGDVICDIVAKNPIESPDPDYAQVTVDYCSGGDPGNRPPPPPDWGGG
jgi:hypothetical protein